MQVDFKVIHMRLALHLLDLNVTTMVGNRTLAMVITFHIVQKTHTTKRDVQEKTRFIVLQVVLIVLVDLLPMEDLETIKIQEKLAYFHSNLGVKHTIDAQLMVMNMVTQKLGAQQGLIIMGNILEVDKEIGETALEVHLTMEEVVIHLEALETIKIQENLP